MPNDKPYMENAGSWKAEFSKRLTDYQTLVDNHRELEKVFEAEKQVALDTLRTAWIEELRGGRSNSCSRSRRSSPATSARSRRAAPPTPTGRPP